MSKESFKLFAKSHPELIEYVNNGKMTWQNFYEIFEIYGEDNEVWKTYFHRDSKLDFSSIKDIFKNIDSDNIQKHINNAQKAIGVVQELAGKKADIPTIKGPTSPRPINNIFED